MTEQFTYRIATSSDQAGILKVFREVAPEVPTVFSSETENMIEGLIATGKSWVAVDTAGSVVGYALAKMIDSEVISLEYAGVATAARKKGVNTALISKLQEASLPIVATVRWNNASSMVERFERLGFVKFEDMPAFADKRTKLRWDTPAS